jgi:hypothetical protein
MQKEKQNTTNKLEAKVNVLSSALKKNLQRRKTAKKVKNTDKENKEV